MRKILHVDMDAFFASVAQRDDPSLRGRPVAVGGVPTGRGVVAAASYEARAFGVRSAMPAARALRLCPELVFVRGDFARYREVSMQMHRIFADYTERIEPVSLDEAYLDVTENRAGLRWATDVAKAIRARIRDELGLTASAGVASSKVVAKIASDHRKPDGLTVVPPERAVAFLRPLPVGALPGVGPSTADRLAGIGVRTIGDLTRADPGALERLLGARAPWLLRAARGEDDREVVTERVRKSRGSSRTFAADLTEPDAVRSALQVQLRALCDDLRRAGERARTVSVTVRYADFRTVQRSATLPVAADASLELAPLVDRLAEPLTGPPIRLVGVQLSNLTRPADALQPALPFPG